MTSMDTLYDEDKHFLATCEELLKDRYTETDEDFMRVFNAVPSKPPIVESWWVPNNSGRRNDRRFTNRREPYDRPGGDRRTYDHRGTRHRF